MARDWKRWFEAYASDWSSGAVIEVADKYGERFMNIKPGKTAVYPNDAGFLRWLERVRGFHLESGLEKVEVVTLRDVPLGEHHVLVSVLWAVRFEKQSTLRIQFEISYVIQLEDPDHPRIVTIVSHEDQRVAMRRHALLPG